MGEFALGQPVARFEDPRLLRGGGRYVDDMVLPHMVSGHVLRSPHAHPRIRSRPRGSAVMLSSLRGRGSRPSLPARR
jgi:CO/xanthine dehydrogenase Mo-binding subunit